MSARKSTVRIIGGEHRGRRLMFTDQNGDLRPTGDRMRETLFNWLQFELRDKRVLDLFAGSGVLGAEALSRGAAHAVLVEKSRTGGGSVEAAQAGVCGKSVYPAGRCAEMASSRGRSF